MKLILRTEHMDAKMENYIITAKDVGKPLRIRVTVVDEEPLLEVWLGGLEVSRLGPTEVREGMPVEPQEAPLGPSTFAFDNNALLPVGGQQDLPAPFWKKLGQQPPQAAEKAQGHDRTHEGLLEVLEALEGQIGDARTALRRHERQPIQEAYWQGAYDTLIGVEQMIERKARA